MTEKNGPGQADKAAAERRTATVAKDNAADKAAADDKAGTHATTPGTTDQGAAMRTAGDDTPERPDGPDRNEGVDAAVAPYPLYEDEPVDALRGLAEGRGVEINRDVEKALLIKALRDKDRSDGPDRVGPSADTTAPKPGPQGSNDSAQNPYPSYDMMPLEELRALASGRDVSLEEADEKAHLVTELRAADSGVNNSGTGTTV